MKEPRFRDLAFVLRCSRAATLPFVLSQASGLPHPVWAAMSGIIVGQEKLGDTRKTTIGRFVGTLLGVIIAVIVGTALQYCAAGPVAEIAVAVGLAATIVRRCPSLKVCMWTCPIVFLTSTAQTPLWEVGMYRGAEVLLGSVVGAALHAFSDRIIQVRYG